MFWKRWRFKKKHVTLPYFWHFPMDLWKVYNWSVQTLKFVGTMALENDFLNAGSTVPLVNRMLEMEELEIASLGISPLLSSLCVKPAVLMCSQTLPAICHEGKWDKEKNEEMKGEKTEIEMKEIGFEEKAPWSPLYSDSGGQACHSASPPHMQLSHKHWLSHW